MTADRLDTPLPSGKLFRDASLVEQHIVLFRFLEEIHDQVLGIAASLDRLERKAAPK